ncbi:uncharacterized protein LOC113343974 [Papaver somniferum]|uniref:uncharacterized protein LOC113343974 n=1 Tax=Papaver somniferum TaxID=3469 RepID=UPI000E6F97C7|nr:uncharacterized protein LOC113343974 [Papaver somniferum]
MRVLYWNINGVAKVEASLKLHELVNVFKPVILCIAEPKIPYSYGVMLRLNLTGFVKKTVHNSSSSSIGNLWILWSEDIEEPVVLNMTRQAITVRTEGVFISFVHASYFQVFRRRLWSQLSAVDYTTPWLVIGDFNCVLRNEENKGGRETLTSSINEFSDWMEENSLFEADSLGSKFTWTNGQSGKRLKVAMKFWNQQVFGNVNARLKQAQLKLEVASRNSDEDPFDTSKQNVMKDALVDVHEVRMQQHIMLKQKSRNKWILEGSSNTSYFHSTIKTRRSANTISKLVTDDGSLINETD